MPLRFKPLTERFLPAGPWRWAAIAAWTSLPIVKAFVFGLLAAAAGLAPESSEQQASSAASYVLNAYVVALALIGTPLVARQIENLIPLGGSEVERTVRRDGSIAVPLMLALFLTVVISGSTVLEYRLAALLATPLPFLVLWFVDLLTRIPQATAFYVSIVALLAVAGVGHRSPPGSFPEDRSLGLAAVGRLLTTILLFYALIVTPVLLVGTQGLVSGPYLFSFVLTLGLFALLLGGMVVAIWDLHGHMSSERGRQVDAARARFANAYRSAEKQPVQSAAAELRAARLMLQGAESIHEWPFDDRTQRIAGIILTGVLSGIVVRVVIFGLGL